MAKLTLKPENIDRIVMHVDALVAAHASKLSTLSIEQDLARQPLSVANGQPAFALGLFRT